MNKSMTFMLEFNLDEFENTKEIHDINLMQYADELHSSQVIDGKYRVYMTLSNLSQIVDLGYYFDRDVKITGVGMNILELC